MKLSKAAIDRIEVALNQLDKGLAYIDKPTTHVIIESEVTAGLEFDWKSHGKRGFSIDKEIGSDLAYLRNARKILKQLITPIIKES